MVKGSQLNCRCVHGVLFNVFCYRIVERIGSGNFGHVESGLWHSPVDIRQVAIKLLKEDATESDKIKFLQEAAINGQFHHRNVVKLIGVVTVEEPVSIHLTTKS